MKVLEKPRFEDYDFTHVSGNPKAWLGNGFTVCERDLESDKSQYLDPENVDFPTVPVVSV